MDPRDFAKGRERYLAEAVEREARWQRAKRAGLIGLALVPVWAVVSYANNVGGAVVGLVFAAFLFVGALSGVSGWQGWVRAAFSAVIGLILLGLVVSTVARFFGDLAAVEPVHRASIGFQRSAGFGGLGVVVDHLDGVPAG